MSKIDVIYEGDLHTLVIHDQSGRTLHTDAPKDHEGKGENFSPTDLVAAGLGSCFATVLGIYAKRKGWDLKGMRVVMEKIMSSEPPRRIATLKVELWFPLKLPLEEEEKVKKIAHSCPVQHSLHPNIKVSLVVHWGEHP